MLQYPVVSILMPMRNARGFVQKALESVLAERALPIEVIVIDDHSVDGSAECVRDIGDERIRVIESEGEGIAAAFNTGLNAARGRYIARCDADDFYPPGRLAEVCKVWYQPKRRYLYRLHSESVTHQLGGMLTGHYDWLARHLQAQRLNGMPDDLERNVAPPAPRSTLPQQSPLAKQIQGILLGTAWQQHSRGRKFQSILTGLRAGVSRPVDLAIWRSVAALVLKRSGSPLPEQFQVPTPHGTNRVVPSNP